MCRVPFYSSFLFFHIIFNTYFTIVCSFFIFLLIIFSFCFLCFFFFIFLTIQFRFFCRPLLVLFTLILYGCIVSTHVIYFICFKFTLISWLHIIISFIRIN